MKVAEFIAKLQELPQDDEIFIKGEYDSIMGDQGVYEPFVDKETIYGRVTKKGYTVWETSVSNYAGDIEKEVWIVSF